MSDQHDNQGDGFELVMPLVTTVSEGGIHDDESYVAGWEMGELDATLRVGRPLQLERFVRTDSLPQMDLLAMRHGYGYQKDLQPDGWTRVILYRFAPQEGL